LVAVFAESAAAIGRPDEALHAIEPLVGDNGIPPRQRSPLLFCLGAIRDRQGEYDAAFEAFAAANRLYPATFDAESHARRIQERIDAWTPERTAGLPRASNADETPVFIIGMPRSGTTLVEQIIATHPEAFGAGERWAIPSLEREFFDARQRGASEADCLDLISRGALDRAATRELRALKRLAPSAGRITDKMMTNFLHLGLVQLVFPGARVVHCRRDPLDTCLSCFFHRFPEGSEPYAYDLEHLAEYRRTYLEITEHWKSVLDLPWLDVTYKDLVADPDAQIPRLIEFLGLAWDDACLRFHESDREVATLSADQVRRPMYRTSVGRYRHYEKHLGPLKRALGLD
jgi:hypothetical protein